MADKFFLIMLIAIAAKQTNVYLDEFVVSFFKCWDESKFSNDSRLCHLEILFVCLLANERWQCHHFRHHHRSFTEGASENVDNV